MSYNAERDVRLFRVFLQRHLNTPAAVVDNLGELPRLAPYDYVVFLGNNAKRYLTTAQLPSEVKSKLAMISAYETTIEWVDFQPDNVGSISQYMNQFPDEFYEIGWRVTKDMYCVLMTDETLDYLRGV
jgi:hypothetical protein